MFFQVLTILLLWCFPIFFLLVLLWCQHQQTKVLRQVRTNALKKQEQLLTFLHGLREPFSENFDQEDLYQYIVEQICPLLSSTGAALYLYQPKKELLHLASLTAEMPPLVIIPDFMKRSEYGLNQHRLENEKERLRNFLKLHDIPLHAGLVGKAAASMMRTELLRRLEIEPQLLTQGLYELLITPLYYRQKLMGVLALGNGPKESFSQEDKRLFEILAQEIASALRHQEMHQEVDEKYLLDHDVELASEVQQLLLPKSVPLCEGYEIAGLNIPARSLSGDYYDFLTLKEDLLGAVIADVSGKGLPAALMMAMCRSVLRHQACNATSPLEIMSRVNRQLYPDMKEDMFISMLFFTLNQTTGEIILSRAGHEPALLYHADRGNIELIQPKGMALGIDNGEVFDRFSQDCTFSLNSGDCLLLYTDGATEALNTEGNSFGIDRLMQFLKMQASVGATALLDHLQEDLQTFSGYCPQQDDITLIAIRKL